MTRPASLPSRGLLPAGLGRVVPAGVLAMVTALLVLVGAGTLLVLTAAPAAAHNRLVSSDPADGSSVAAAPTAVVLTFNQPALALGTQILVTGPEGPVGQGAPELVDDRVRQALAPGAPAGRYTVDWRVSSADGHPITGRLTFTAEAAGGGPAPAADGTGPGSAASGSTTGTSSGGWVVPTLGGLIVAAVGVLVLRRRTLNRQVSRRP